MSAEQIRHRPDCPDPTDLVDTTGSNQAPIRLCRSCRRWITLDPDPRAADPRPNRAAYVCRDHPDRPVTWRGTGCVDCAAEKQDRDERHD